MHFLCRVLSITSSPASLCQVMPFRPCHTLRRQQDPLTLSSVCSVGKVVVRGGPHEDVGSSSSLPERCIGVWLTSHSGNSYFLLFFHRYNDPGVREGGEAACLHCWLGQWQLHRSALWTAALSPLALQAVTTLSLLPPLNPTDFSEGMQVNFCRWFLVWLKSPPTTHILHKLSHLIEK